MLVQLVVLHPTAAATSAVTVASSAISGYELGGASFGAVGAIVAVITLGITITANNRKKRQDYESEIQAAYTRGRDSVLDATELARRDSEFWRNLYFSARGEVPHVIPQPPSQRTEAEGGPA